MVPPQQGQLVWGRFANPASILTGFQPEQLLK
jgi:hypothetical protein